MILSHADIKNSSLALWDTHFPHMSAEHIFPWRNTAMRMLHSWSQCLTKMFSGEARASPVSTSRPASPLEQGESWRHRQGVACGIPTPETAESSRTTRDHPGSWRPEETVHTSLNQNERYQDICPENREGAPPFRL